MCSSQLFSRFVMELNRAFKLKHFIFCFFSFILTANLLTVKSCNATKCHQSPCYLSTIDSSSTTGIKRQHASTSNDLNPLINNQLSSSIQDDEHTLIEASVKHKTIPNYMLDIYGEKSHKLATGNSYDNVRNYRAISEIGVDYFESIYQRNNLSVVHHLLFNVTTLPSEEHLQEAELKLWAQVHFSKENLLGANRRLFRIYLMNGYNYNPWDLEILDFKFIIESKETWLTFNVTHAVQWWTKNNIKIQMIQVRIDPVSPVEAKFGSIDISLDRSNGEGTDPQLVIYSSTKNFTKFDHAVTKRDADVYLHSRPLGKNQRKSKSTPNCRRRSLYINFTQINYDQWIVAPDGYDAYECVGRCDFPLSDHLTPSKHSILQSILHAIQPSQVGKVCCVPVRLAPISLLYFDEQGILTYKYHYDEMVVAECGCR